MSTGDPVARAYRDLLLQRDYDDCVRFVARLIGDGHAPFGMTRFVSAAIESRFSPRAITAVLASFYANNRSPEYWVDAFESAVHEQQTRMTGKRRNS